ncbi:unnamed protein product, partial [Staurois parvus]
MRCPWYLFHRLFRIWARTQGPHDPLLPGGPMSCQSAPAFRPCLRILSVQTEDSDQGPMSFLVCTSV